MSTKGGWQIHNIATYDFKSSFPQGRVWGVSFDKQEVPPYPRGGKVLWIAGITRRPGQPGPSPGRRFPGVPHERYITRTPPVSSQDEFIQLPTPTVQPPGSNRGYLKRMAAMRPASAGHQVRIQFRYACRPGKPGKTTHSSRKPRPVSGWPVSCFSKQGRPLFKVWSLLRHFVPYQQYSTLRQACPSGAGYGCTGPSGIALSPRA